jgi:hypothetical protein
LDGRSASAASDQRSALVAHGDFEFDQAALKRNRNICLQVRIRSRLYLAVVAPPVCADPYRKRLAVGDVQARQQHGRSAVAADEGAPSGNVATAGAQSQGNCEDQQLLRGSALHTSTVPGAGAARVQFNSRTTVSRPARQFDGGDPHKARADQG